VRTIIPSADRQKATVKVRISFLKLDPRILPDMGIKVTFLGEAQPQRSSARAAILVPQNAVRDENGTKIVMVVKDNKAERRAVTVSGARGSDTEIIAGLGVGDQVIVRGPENLRDGQNVEVKK
jgi:multidrug efflux pump subunit AcrA (membrane-fusion protein)